MVALRTKYSTNQGGLQATMPGKTRKEKHCEAAARLARLYGPKYGSVDDDRPQDFVLRQLGPSPLKVKL